MISTTLKIHATDGIVVANYESLTPAHYAELLSILSEPATKAEIQAVIQGLAEDWERAASNRLVALPFEQN